MTEVTKEQLRRASDALATSTDAAKSLRISKQDFHLGCEEFGIQTPEEGEALYGDVSGEEEGVGECSEAKARPGWITFWGYSNSILGGVVCVAGLAATTSGENEGFLIFVSGAVSLIVGIGLLKLRPWGRKLAIGVLIASMFLGLFALPGSVIGLIVQGFILRYFFLEKIKLSFAPLK